MQLRKGQWHLDALHGLSSRLTFADELLSFQKSPFRFFITSCFITSMEDPTLRHGEIFFQFEDLVEDVRNLLISTFLDKPSLVLLALTSNKYHGLIKPSFENFDFSEAANVQFDFLSRDFSCSLAFPPRLHHFLKRTFFCQKSILSSLMCFSDILQFRISVR